MSKHMRPVYDERDDEIDAHSKSRAWDFVVVCIEVFTILCVVKGNTAWIGCLALLFAGMAANMMYRFDEYEERAYFHGGLILGPLASLCLSGLGSVDRKGMCSGWRCWGRLFWFLHCRK